jgi:hypothetical protein
VYYSSQQPQSIQSKQQVSLLTKVHNASDLSARAGYERLVATLDFWKWAELVKVIDFAVCVHDQRDNQTCKLGE